MSSQPSEKAGIVGKIDPKDVNGLTPDTGEIDMSRFEEVAFILQVGVVNSSGSIDFKIEESDVSGFGSGVSDIPDKSISTIGGTDDNKVVIVNLKAEEVSKRYVRGLLTSSAHSNFASCVALGLKPRFGPAGDYNIPEVKEVVT